MDLHGGALDAGSGSIGGDRSQSAMSAPRSDEEFRSNNLMAADKPETAASAGSGSGGFAADRIPAPPEGEAIDYRSVPPSFVAKGMAPRPVADRALIDADVLSMPRRSEGHAP
ncbi:hypothetical protein VaNZ11_003180 [Volvox africanus]|uniref:Uncharacterized protein n=1 Tax=Volvox africanus TaxID=51714 RepID=A0ABQ5RTP9_9CHLO|nr:hypothetical protein VaNZ11_003180 [Volvox africanus]